MFEPAPSSAPPSLFQVIGGLNGMRLATEIEGLDPERLGGDDQLELAEAWARVEAFAVARKFAAVAAFAGRGELVPGAEPTASSKAVPEQRREEIALALRVSPISAGNLISTARALTGPLRDTLTMLAAGRLMPAHASVMAAETSNLPEPVALAAQQRVLARCEGKTPAQLRRHMRAAVIAADPRTAHERHIKARGQRYLRMWPDLDGMAMFEARLPADNAAALWRAADSHARICHPQAGAPDDPGIEARRADALVRLAITGEDALGDGAGRCGGPVSIGAGPAPRNTAAGAADDTGAARQDAEPVAPPRRSRVLAHVVVDLPTLLGLADNPGELHGYGPVPAMLARELAADATWQRMITEPRTGSVLELGRARYVPGDRLRAYITARDQYCRFPGCHQPAEHCDLDHATAWDSGGGTSPANLGALCRRHHQLKTHHDWKILASNADGSVTWISPHGRVASIRPVPALPWQLAPPILTPPVPQPDDLASGDPLAELPPLGDLASGDPPPEFPPSKPCLPDHARPGDTR